MENSVTKKMETGTTFKEMPDEQPKDGIFVFDDRTLEVVFIRKKDVIHIQHGVNLRGKEDGFSGYWHAIHFKGENSPAITGTQSGL
jgi:hypothetical protein